MGARYSYATFPAELRHALHHPAVRDSRRRRDRSPSTVPTSSTRSTPRSSRSWATWPAGCESDAAVRGVILTGAGTKAFVAGADIGEIAAQGPVDGKERSLDGQRVFRRLERCGKPVIAAVNGFALGGGCELAMACHLRIASEQARFGQPEVKLGIGPGYGGTVRLPRLVGRGRALELLLTGQMIDAQEAYRIGLVNRVVPADRLLAESEQLLRAILENGPLAVRACLEAVDAGSRHRGRRGAAAGGEPLRPALRNRRHAGGHGGLPGEAEGRFQGVVSSDAGPAFRAFPPVIFQVMPAKVIRRLLLALLLGCDERERLTFETDPTDRVGPSTQIRHAVAGHDADRGRSVRGRCPDDRYQRDRHGVHRRSRAPT